MKELNKIILVILIVIIVIGFGFIIWKNIDNEKNNNNNTIVTGGKEINYDVLELSTQKAIIEIVNKEYYKNITDIEGTTAAEGNKILKAEVKDNQIYAYVVAEYGVYKLENGEVTPVSASASPITIIFDMEYENGYNMIKYLIPSNNGDEAWLSSLKEMFPEDLINEAKSIDYTDDFYGIYIHLPTNPRYRYQKSAEVALH